jgi:hypothetical protein
MALISQSSFRGYLPSSPSPNKKRWEATYLERRARDSRRYNRSYREESEAVEPEAISPPGESRVEPMAVAPASDTPKRRKRQQMYTSDEPTTRRDRAEAKATAARLRDEAASPAKRRYRRHKS